MIFGQDRNELREMYATAWRKREAGEVLSPLETQIADVIALHPEFRATLTGNLDHDYPIEAGETNPVRHMGLHLGIREQVATDRPAGIRQVFLALVARHGDEHTAEHRMIDCLAEALWEAQRRNAPPDEIQYLENLKRLAS